MNGFEKRAHGIKIKIMTTTLRMLGDKEAKQLRIADIAKEANVSQVTIYNYFGSKEALLRETFIRYVNEAVEAFEAYLNEEHSLKEKIARILQLEKTTYKELPPARLKELIDGDPEIARYVEELSRDKSIPLTLRILEEGKQSGEIAEDVSVEAVVAFLSLYMNQYEALLDMAQKSGDTDKFLEGMVNFFFYGISGYRPT